MKKLLFTITFIMASVYLLGQSWDHTYSYLPVDSITGKDTVQLLGIAADPSDDSTFTLQMKDIESAFHASPTFTGTITIGAAGISETELEILDGATLTTTELNYVDGVTSAIQTQIDAKLNTADTLDANTQVWMLADTVVLASFNASDSLNTSFFYGSFYNGGSDTLVVTEMRAVLQGTTPSVTVDIEWHATFGSGSATGLNTTPPTITSTTTGDSDTSFDNSEIPPGVFVWCKTPTVTTEPTYMSVTLLGYRKNAAY